MIILKMITKIPWIKTNNILMVPIQIT